MKYIIYLFTVCCLLGCPPPPVSLFHDYYDTSLPVVSNGDVYSRAAAISIDNCLVVGGYMWGRVKFGNNIMINLPLSPGNLSNNGLGIFLEKFDQHNNPIFAKLIGSVSSSNSHPRISVNISDVALDDACNIYACGNFEGNLQLPPNNFINTLVGGGNMDCFYAKFDPSGNLVWIRQISGPGWQRIKSIKVYEKDIYVAGTFLSATNFLTQQFTTFTGTNGFYCRYQQSDGKPGPDGWENIIEAAGAGDITVEDMDVNKDSVLLVGGFHGTYNFSGITKFAQWNNSYVAKAGKNGAIHSVGQFESQNNNSYVLVQSGFLDAYGGVVCSGNYAGQVDFEPGSALSLQNSTGSGEDLFIADYYNTGQNRWIHVYGSPAEEQHCLVKKNSRQEIFAIGDYNGTVNFGVQTLNGSVNASGWGGAFILKLKSLGAPLWVADAQTTGVSGIGGFAVSPNRERMVAGLDTGSPVTQVTTGFDGTHYPVNTHGRMYLTFYGN